MEETLFALAYSFYLSSVFLYAFFLLLLHKIKKFFNLVGTITFIQKRLTKS